MIFAIIEIDAGDEIGRVISSQAVINSGRCSSFMKVLNSNFNCFTSVWPQVVKYLQRIHVIILLLWLKLVFGL